jgi:hypothetical protein
MFGGNPGIPEYDICVGCRTDPAIPALQRISDAAMNTGDD